MGRYKGAARKTSAACGLEKPRDLPPGATGMGYEIRQILVCWDLILNIVHIHLECLVQSLSKRNASCQISPNLFRCDMWDTMREQYSCCPNQRPLPHETCFSRKVDFYLVRRGEGGEPLSPKTLLHTHLPSWQGPNPRYL